MPAKLHRLSPSREYIATVTDPADPAAYPDMGAIRAAHDAPRPRVTPRLDGGSAAIDRFLRSLVIDYEKWHDGIGFDVDALREATPAERTPCTTSRCSPSYMERPSRRSTGRSARCF
jgi:hypothetical protein